MYSRHNRIPEPPVRGSTGDQGITALFVLLVLVLLTVGMALYLGMGLFFLY